MSLINDFMPQYRLREVEHVSVAAAPERAWATLRSTDLYRLPLVRTLFRIRTAPEKLVARLRGRPVPAEPRRARIDDLASSPGFLLLGEGKRELVVGSIGTFWRPSIEWAKVAPAEFAAFAAPGFGKLAWSLRVDPGLGGGSWITFDRRVSATDDLSWARFHRYWLLIGGFSRAIRRGGLALCQRELGRGAREATLPLPGDELLPAARLHRTHARTIEAPPAQVWPWLVQMGCRRAGWYSIDRLDNGGVHSAERILPQLQHLEVGDLIPASPTRPDTFAVRRVDPGRALVLESPGNGEAQPFQTTWAFALEPIGDDATRLIVRTRAAAVTPGLRAASLGAFYGGAHELMERTQLRNLKRRAERAPV